MKSKHNRKIVFSGIDLVGASMTNDLQIMGEVRKSIEPLMINSGYLKSAPFTWVGMVFRYGLKHEIKPHYRRIDQKDGELELAKELDMRILLTADETDPDFLLKDFLEIATLDSLIHAGKKYNLKIDGLVERRNRLGQIPSWDPAMDDFPELLKEQYLTTLPLVH
jgi:hypothetical protein